MKSKNRVKMINWGEFYWFVIHSICETDKLIPQDKIRCLFRISATIPCESCHEEFYEYLAKHKETMVISNEKIIIGMFHFHNIVNKKLEKKICTWENYLQLAPEYKNHEKNKLRFYIFIKIALLNSDSFWEINQIYAFMHYLRKIFDLKIFRNSYSQDELIKEIDNELEKNGINPRNVEL